MDIIDNLSMNPISLRLLNQQLVVPQFGEPGEVGEVYGCHAGTRIPNDAVAIIIAKDGIICGNWSPFTDDCQADFFLDEHTGNLQEEWARYQKFLLR